MKSLKIALGAAVVSAMLASAHAAIAPYNKLPAHEALALVNVPKIGRAGHCGEFKYFDKNAKTCADARMTMK